jgi:hypothetical protein
MIDILIRHNVVANLIMSIPESIELLNKSNNLSETDLSVTMMRLYENQLLCAGRLFRKFNFNN